MRALQQPAKILFKGKGKSGGLGVQKVPPEKQVEMSKTSFTSFEDAYIKAHYMTTPIKTIAKHLGRSYCGVTGRMKFYGLEVPGIIRRMRKQKGMFRKGQTPMNKGLKQADFMSAEAIERTKKTRFKKGNEPHNTRSDGEISIRKDKSGLFYKYIRIKKAKWELLHRVNYRKAFGEIPDDSCIRFIDGDQMNCEPENLQLITKQLNCLANSIHNYPPEVKTAIRTLSKLNKTIKNHGKKQD